MIRKVIKLYKRLKAHRPNLSILSYGCYDADNLYRTVYHNKSLGIKKTKCSYFDSDILLITGKISWNNIAEVSSVLKKVSKKCIIIAYGSCACQKVSRADIYIPGCPPSNKNLADGIRLAKKRMQQ